MAPSALSASPGSALSPGPASLHLPCLLPRACQFPTQLGILETGLAPPSVHRELVTSHSDSSNGRIRPVFFFFYLVETFGPIIGCINHPGFTAVRSLLVVPLGAHWAPGGHAHRPALHGLCHTVLKITLHAVSSTSDVSLLPSTEPVLITETRRSICHRMPTGQGGPGTTLTLGK